MKKKQAQKPVVSILLPVYNNEAFLKNCLESLRAQSFRNFEIIAIDDDSTDRSYRLLLRAKKKDKRIKVYKNKKHYGLAVMLNRMVRRSKGQCIAFMSPHDVSLKNRIRAQLLFLKKHPQAAGVGTQCFFINKNSKKIGKSLFPEGEEEIVQHLLSLSNAAATLPFIT
ncbi:MAG: Glycosyl transferase family 2 [Microgenomates group bacterium GW2011_GWA2_47_8]|nr:MAG: Glycosyl transferase family 2 [Microgenomates group bacterium GW2011_GWA2_47_8]